MWNSYVGKELFIKWGLSAADFALMSKMGSWATCSKTTREWELEIQDQAAKYGHASEKLHPNYGRLSHKTREDIGIMCKRLIDVGRLEYLRQHNYKSNLCYYVPVTDTLENVLLTAVKS